MHGRLRRASTVRSHLSDNGDAVPVVTRTCMQYRPSSSALGTFAARCVDPGSNRPAVARDAQPLPGISHGLIAAQNILITLSPREHGCMHCDASIAHDRHILLLHSLHLMHAAQTGPASATCTTALSSAPPRIIRAGQDALAWAPPAASFEPAFGTRGNWGAPYLFQHPAWVRGRPRGASLTPPRNGSRGCPNLRRRHGHDKQRMPPPDRVPKGPGTTCSLLHTAHLVAGRQQAALPPLLRNYPLL